MTSKVIYDSFNARYLSFTEVSDSFIVNDYFNGLIQNSHSLLMGPRGCGKTTLLKMLTPPALLHWDKKHKVKLLNDLAFYGVYIPTDIHWKIQLDQLQRDFSDSELTKTISRATVNINILISLVKTFSFLTTNIIENSEKEKDANEIKLCKILYSQWKFENPIIPNLDSLELELLSYISHLNAEIRKWKTNSSYQPSLKELYYIDFIDLVRSACKAFEMIYKIDDTKRWALCFDELEIAPEWLQVELLGFLRSRDQKILFKLTTAPIISLFKEELNILNASETNDFNVVKIWTSDQVQFKSWAEFCEKLIKSRLSRKSKNSVDLSNIFGYSLLDKVIIQAFPKVNFDNSKLNFEVNTPTWYITKELAKIDSSFYQFLKEKKIDPLNPVPKDIKQKDQIFRKIKQIVIYRHQFKKEGSKRRSRKVIPLYFGIPLIYELCDGNPRILIGMIDDLLKHQQVSDSGFRELTINEQSRILNEISTKYLLITSSHPDANVIIKDKNTNIKDILDQIGNFFHNKMIDEPFTMDPTGSFIVDENINYKYLELIQLALYLGAIVYLDSHDILSKKGVVGKKFRLSYTLSPNYGLLSREFKEVNLSSILQKTVSDEQNQPKLFN